MKSSLMLVTGLLAAGIGLSSIPNTAEASCKSICVVAWRDCIRYAGGDPGLEAACDAELDQCIVDCDGGVGLSKAQLIWKDESLQVASTTSANCSRKDPSLVLGLN